VDKFKIVMSTAFKIVEEARKREAERVGELKMRVKVARKTLGESTEGIEVWWKEKVCMRVE